MTLRPTRMSHGLESKSYDKDETYLELSIYSCIIDMYDIDINTMNVYKYHKHVEIFTIKIYIHKLPHSKYDMF